ncbi:hypothetical protein SAMN05660420_03394 [Desulfuromusa kysingii]|uniref:Uncharacterized protein n=1 Tax=Desulfuromusa kysingii TaxID=37625 RepID=A0A1H4EI45_9BACT|nr:hypothetical protein [Desulfuromusa kysingii]SEA84705.1 hypothetical protein SAMN05660420_03394 [Desulfuromusa kysingii]
MKEILNLVLVFFLSSYLFIVPIVFLVVMLFLLGTRKTKKGRWMIAVVSLIGVALMAWYGFGRVAYYDWQVRKLCAIDGGVKVYETVELTPDLLDKFGRISIPYKTNATADDLYFYEKEKQYLRKKKPTLIRTRTVIIRLSDNKVLGELIRYGRGGGDLPSFGHPSSFSCPDPVKGSNFENSIFLKGDEK